MLTFFWHISYMTWYLYHYACKQTNKKTNILRASIYTLISCTCYTHVIFISYAYHSKNIYLGYWWHLGSNHVTCWPFSTRNRRATINKCKNTNLTPARAPQDMLTYVYLCPYLGFWPTQDPPAITPEIVSRSQTHQHVFFFPGFAPLFMRIPQHRNVPIWVLDFNPPG